MVPMYHNFVDTLPRWPARLVERTPSAIGPRHTDQQDTYRVNSEPLPTTADGLRAELLAANASATAAVSVVRLRVRPGCYHHPLRLAQTSRMADITSMTSRSTVSASQCVELLTMTFMPSTEERAVIGRVTAAITASRSAAMVILVLVRVW